MELFDFVIRAQAEIQSNFSDVFVRHDTCERLLL